MYEDSTMVNSHDVLETALDMDPLNNGLPLESFEGMGVYINWKGKGSLHKAC
jgi:hypothetical protein